MKNFVLATLLFFTTLYVQAQSITTHTVQRGETIESVAQKYGVSVADLTQANPDLSEYFFVGMKLTIPEKKTGNSAVVDKKPSTPSVPSESSVEETKEISFDDNTSINNSIYYGIYAGYSMNKYTGKDAKDYDMNSGFHVGVFVGQNISSIFFIESGLGLATKGYKYKIKESSGEYWQDDDANYDTNLTEKMKTYNIEMPLYFGLKFDDFFIKGGPYINYAISGKKTTSGTNTFYEDIHSSETEKISSSHKIKDLKNYNDFNYGVVASVGFMSGNVIISGSFQRGFNKIFKKSKQYEQNILFSIGYVF